MNRMSDRFWGMYLALVAGLAGLLLLPGLCPRSYAAERIEDETLHFTLRLPDGFEKYPALVGETPDTVHAFIRGNPNDEAPDIVLLIERMRGTLGRNRLDPHDMPAGFKGRLMTANWHPFELDCVEVREELEGMMFVTYNVQVPLKEEAIQLKLAGRMERKAELQSLLAEILNGLEGDSNWIPSLFESSFGLSKWYRAVKLTIGIVIVAGGSGVLWLASKKRRILATSIVIFAIGWLPDGMRLVEARLLSGSLKMLGVAGIVIHFLRKRPRPVQAERAVDEPFPGPG